MKRVAPPDVVGMTFGAWTVRARVAGPSRQSKYECVCACGLVRQISRGNLTQGKTKSCGCMKSTLLKTKRTTHGMSGDTKAYRAWSSMITRCFNENCKAWANYGGRGVKVCARWLKFENFFADVGNPTAGQSLDRINTDGDYEPGNVRWADSKTQARNRRVVRLNETAVAAMRSGKLHPLDVVESTGCKRSTAYAARRGQNWKGL